MRKTILVMVTAVLLLLSNNTALSQTLEQAKAQQVKQALNGPHGQQIKNAVKKYSAQYKLEETLILAVIMTESGFNPRAVSPCKATGLMQLIPSTFRAKNVGSNIYNIDANIHAGTKHLAGLRDRHKGNIYLALSSYNMGGANVPIQGRVPRTAKPYINKVYYHKAIIEGTL